MVGDQNQLKQLKSWNLIWNIPFQLQFFQFQYQALHDFGNLGIRLELKLQ